MSVIKQVKQLLTERSGHFGVNKEIRKIAKVIAEAAPAPDDEQIVLSFNASTRITGVTWHESGECVQDTSLWTLFDAILCVI